MSLDSRYIQADFGRLFRFLDKWEQALTNNPAAWRAMSIPYYGYISRIFKAQGIPVWKDLAESTKKQRRNKKKFQIGVDTGQMRASLTGPSSPGSVIAFGRNHLVVGTMLKRARWFHDGTTNSSGRLQQPARTILQNPDARTTTAMLRAFLHVARKKAK
ncbi:MAG: hypothetical protein KDB65_13495 [Calditrichaeota bacterium]|nr:hypothetical protein [Calditrichota bacterium]